MGLGFKPICGNGSTNVYLSRDFDEGVCLRREKLLGKTNSLYFSFNSEGAKLIDVRNVKEGNTDYKISAKGKGWLKEMGYDCSSKDEIDAAIDGLVADVLKGL